MKTAKDIMTTDPITVSADTKLSDAVKILLEKHFNGLPVVDDENKLIGILTQSDLVAQHQKIDFPSYFVLFDAAIPLQAPFKFEESLEKMLAETVKELMTTEVFSIDLDTPIDYIASYMVETKRYSLPVLDDGKLVGIVGKEDVLRTMMGM